MNRSDKSRKLASEAGKLFDSASPTENHTLNMARKALGQAADSLLIAAHYFDEYEQEVAQYKAQREYERAERKRIETEQQELEGLREWLLSPDPNTQDRAQRTLAAKYGPFWRSVLGDRNRDHE